MIGLRFDEAHVKLAREAQCSACSEQRQNCKTRIELTGGKGRKGRSQNLWPVGDNGHGKAGNREQCEQLDHRFNRNGEHQPGILARPVCTTRTKQDGEQGHAACDQQHQFFCGYARLEIGVERQQRCAHGLQLQRHIGQRSDGGEDRYQCGDDRAFPVTS